MISVTSARIAKNGTVAMRSSLPVARLPAAITVEAAEGPITFRCHARLT
jgi:hypothetical protein